MGVFTETPPLRAVYLFGSLAPRLQDVSFLKHFPNVHFQWTLGGVILSHSPESENTALTVTNPIDGFEETS